MDLDSLNRWLLLFANLGVVVGIVFLAIEVSQNRVALEESNRINVLNARTVELEQYNHFRDLLAENGDLSELWRGGLAGDELGTSDWARFELLCKNYIWLSVTAYERSLALNRPATAEGTVKLRADVLRKSPGFRRCWEAEKGTITAYGLASYVEAVEALAGAE